MVLSKESASYLFATIIVLVTSTFALGAEQDQSFKDLDLDGLLNQRVSLHRESDTASGVQESIVNAPAAMVILTKQEISKRGYLSLDEILSDLPGFDTIITNGSFPSVTYQRGYRTPRTQRTLLLINGKVDNNLWNHTALISKQYPIQAVERIEVLYGPAGAVYGPNAFLGVINIITRDPRTLAREESYLNAQLIAGNYDSYGLDFTAAGSIAAANFVVSGKLYQSDGPELTDYSTWGYSNEALLSDAEIWGKAIATSDFDNNGFLDKFAGNYTGIYGDKTKDESLMAEVSIGNWKLGVLYWQMDEGYGPYFPLDKGQSNVSWFHDSHQYYLDHRTQINKLDVTSELLYREANVFGFWAENFNGAVSLSNWNAFNNAWRFRQNYSYGFSRNLQLNGGLKFERKQLSKAYRLCGYWAGSLCPAEGGISVGANIRRGDDRDEVPLPASINRDAFDPLSKQSSRDLGAFVQAIYTSGPWRINAGLRWDNNSTYGSVFNPRGALIYHYSPTSTFKLIYGQAFQEASARLLYGGWTGRAANPDLEPETVKNLEAIAIFQTEHILHDISLFMAQYDDVIVNGGAGNLGGRDVKGIEYRGKLNLPNPFFDGEDIISQLYYTYTDAQSDYQFFQAYHDDGSSDWVKQKDDTGDIAPHKVSLNVDVPLSENWSFNVQANWVGERTLFSQNPLRAKYNNNRESSQDRKAESFLTVDLNIRYQLPEFTTGIKVKNIFSEDYLQPGVESANSGDDFSQPSVFYTMRRQQALSLLHYNLYLLLYLSHYHMLS